MTLSRRALSSAVLQIAARLCSAVVSFVITAVALARVLPPTEYGRCSFYLTLFLLVLQLVDFGANRAAIRMIASKEIATEPAFRAAFVLRTIVGVLAFCVIASIVFAMEGRGGSRALLLIAASHVLTHGFGAGSIPFESEVDFKMPSLSVVAGCLVFLVLGLLLAAKKVATAEPYLIAYGAGFLVQNGWIYLAARGRLRGDAQRVDRPLLARLFREALPLGLSAISIAIYYYCDTLLLRPLRGEADVAAYSVAYRLMSFALMVPVLVSQVLFPVFARCAGAAPEILGKAVRRATFYMAYGAAAVSAVLFVLAEPMLGFVYGDAYRGSAPILRVLGVAIVIVYLTYPHTTALIAIGRAKQFTAITVASAILNVALNLIVLPRFGPLGAAATTLVTEVFVFVCGAYFLWRAAGVHGLYSGLLPTLCVFGASFVAMSLLSSHWPFLALLGVGVIVPVLLLVPLRAWPFDLRVEEGDLA